MHKKKALYRVTGIKTFLLALKQKILKKLLFRVRKLSQSHHTPLIGSVLFIGQNETKSENRDLKPLIRAENNELKPVTIARQIKAV